MGYRCIRDPALLGQKGKAEYQKLRGGPSQDPRAAGGAAGGAARAGSKRRYHSAIPLPLLRYDSHSVGPPPATFLLVRGFSQLTTARHLQAALSAFGAVETCDLAINDQMVSLGAARVRFAGTPSQAHHLAAKLITQGVRIDSEPLKIEWDESRAIFDSILAEARRKIDQSIRSTLDAARRREKDEARRLQARTNERARRERHILIRSTAFSERDLEALLQLPVAFTGYGYAIFFESEPELLAGFRRVQALWCNGTALAKVSKIRDPIERPASAPSAGGQPQSVESASVSSSVGAPAATPTPAASAAALIKELKQAIQQDILNKVVMPAIVESLTPHRDPLSTRTTIKRKPEKMGELRLHFQRKRPRLETPEIDSAGPETNGTDGTDFPDASPDASPEDTAPSSVEDEPEPKQTQQEMVDNMNAEMNAEMSAQEFVEVPFGSVRASSPEPIVLQPKEQYMYLSSFERLMLDEQDFQAAKRALAATSGASNAIKPQHFNAWTSVYRQMEHLHREASTEMENVDAPYLTPTWNTGIPVKSWRSRGCERIESTKKTAFLPHRRNVQDPSQVASKKVSSVAIPPANQDNREARISSRRQARDLKTFETDSLSFNQLLRQSKKVKFALSAIHDWGLYASEPIGAGDMIIEYVGQVIRSPLADVRERYYCLNGIGSSYLFRVDQDVVIDATKRGNIARLINHSCTPTCIARVIKAGGEKRICIYAARPIQPGDELTYDYRFEREDDEDRIPCLCGTENCRGYLN